MQQANFKSSIFRTFAFTVFCLTVFSYTSHAGLDSYSIYLNNKLVLKQSVNEPLKIEGLQLEKANMNDKLVIYYSQCNVPNKIGKGRSIIVKDENGNKLKEWKFDDVEVQDKGMVIAVKDLLEFKKAGKGRVTLVYAADQLAKGQALAGVKFG